MSNPKSNDSVRAKLKVRAIEIPDAPFHYRLKTFEMRCTESVAWDPKDQIRTPEQAANLLFPMFAELEHGREHFLVLFLNKANRISGMKVVSSGGMSASVVDAHEVFRGAILFGASSIILSHNHPSGNPEPSREDIALTRVLVDAGAVLQLPVYDHIIIACDGFTSFKQRRLM